MELEKLRELIETTKSFKSNPACQELAEHFETFVELARQQKEGLEDPEYFVRFEKCMKAFWLSFDKAAKSLGLVPDALKANLNNKDYFEPEQWNSMQALKQEITGEKPEESKPGKQMGNKKRVRV